MTLKKVVRGVYKVSSMDDYDRWESRFFTNKREAQKYYREKVQEFKEYGDQDDYVDDYVLEDFIPMPRTLKELWRILDEHGCDQ